MNILSLFLSDCLSKVLMISYFQFIFPDLLSLAFVVHTPIPICILIIL